MGSIQACKELDSAYTAFDWSVAGIDLETVNAHLVICIFIGNYQTMEPEDKKQSRKPKAAN